MAIFGVQPYGIGTNAVATDGGGKAITNPYSGAQNGSRKIDPYTRDYVFDSTTGRIQGMTNAQQLVYLAVRTDKGSSAMRALGQELMRIERITSNFVRRVDDTLRAAVQHIVDRKLIVVLGTQVDIVRPGVARARLRWRDLETGDEEATEIGHTQAPSSSSQAPLITALSYDLVDTAGGTSITIVGANLSGATSVTVGGTAGTLGLNTPNALTFTTPAKTAGTYSVVVTTSKGTSNSLSLETWSPSDLGAALKGYWAPNFTGSPWVGSVGGNLSTLGTVPAVSSALNGYTGADFTSSKGLVSASAASTYFSAGAYTMVALVYVRSFALADPGVSGGINCPGILSSGNTGGAPKGGIAGTGSSGVFRWDHTLGTTCPISTNVWTMIMARWDGTNLDVGRNFEPVSSVTGEGAPVLTSTLRTGPNWDSSKYFDGIVISGALSNTALSEANRNRFRRYFNSKFALSL